MNFDYENVEKRNWNSRVRLRCQFQLNVLFCCNYYDDDDDKATDIERENLRNK